MILVVCLDDSLGMMFNNRRQSRDRILIADLVRYADGRTVRVSPYSAPLFPEDTPALSVVSDPQNVAEQGELYFCEEHDPVQIADRVEEIVIYRWNRLYPSDLRFTLDLGKFTLVGTECFVGSSHEKITKEIWKK